MIAEILAGLSLMISCLMLIAVYRFQKAFRPLISRAYTIMSKRGVETRISNENMAKVEGALSEFALEQVMQKYPEVGVLMQWLEQKYPDVAEIIEQNPDIVMALAQKYLPLIQQYLGKRSSEFAVQGAV